jgi:4-diphosphocytidyl-2-C-methyl-D-erythritol kinase
MLTESAPAKVNLCLLLGPVRADGRHELVSVMQSITLADELRLRDWDGPGDEVRCAGVEGPNLAADALAAYRRATGWDGPAQLLEIDKRVPVAAGLGGGSGDAAAALRLIARRAGAEADLLALARDLGADVPAQVQPGRWLASGAGEVLEPLAGEERGVLVLPSRAKLSTAAVYAEADRLGLGRSAQELEALRGGALPAVNDLEPAALSLEPSIAAALAAARGVGAENVMVSGSGPTVYGLFESLAGAERAAAALADRDPPAIAAAAVIGAVRHN